MKSAAIFRLESLLQAKQLDGTLAGLRLDPGIRTASTGLEELDEMLGGGWRRGEVSELVGARSTGRTSVLLATLAAATARGEVVGLVDAVDRFDPESAAAAGVALDRVLWVRGPTLTVELARPAMIERTVHQAIRALDLIVRAGGFAIVALDAADVPARHLRALPLDDLAAAGARQRRPRHHLPARRRVDDGQERARDVGPHGGRAPMEWRQPAKPTPRWTQRASARGHERTRGR